MTAPTLRRYRLTLDERGFGWAIVVIGDDGYFSSVSDFGNYAYGWWHHGRESFRHFLIELTDDPGYTYRKLRGALADPYDDERTLRAVKDFILEERRSGNWTKERARKEWDLVEYYGLGTDHDFVRWADETTIDDAWEFGCTKPDAQLWAFCTRVMPKLAEVLRAELEAEAASAEGSR
jgi:hypothetical protein